MVLLLSFLWKKWSFPFFLLPLRQESEEGLPSFPSSLFSESRKEFSGISAPLPLVRLQAEEG